jgi:hypothetical protein
MTKNVARNSAQRFARARYLDTAIKHLDLSFGSKEAGELSNTGDDANELSNFGEDARNLYDPVTFWDHPITGLEAYFLHRCAQGALAKSQGMRFSPAGLYLNLSQVGQTAVRLMLRRDGRPDLSDWLIEVGSLDEVSSHFLCSLDPQTPQAVRLIGWLSTVEIRESKKERLIEEGPEVYAVPIQKLHSLETYDHV